MDRIPCDIGRIVFVEKMKTKLLNLISAVQFLPSGFSDLGWDSNGCPEGENCDEFENELRELVVAADGLKASVQKIDSDLLDRIARLSLEEQHAMVNFLDNLTAGDILCVGKNAMMSRQEANASAEAIYKFNNES
jgi:hypothetical protein